MTTALAPAGRDAWRSNDESGALTRPRRSEWNFRGGVINYDRLA